MSRGLATVPHAPIRRVKHATGEIDHPATGSYCKIAAALGIFPRVAEQGAEIVVQFGQCDWIFTVTSEDEAVEYARQLTHLAGR